MMRSRLLLTAVIAAAAALVTACGKGETNASMKTRPNGPLQLPEAKLEAKGDSVDANEALKERLARQEAATRLFDKTRAEAPAPAPRAEPAPAPARSEPPVAKAEPQRAAEPVRTAAATPASPPPVAAPAPAPASVPVQAPAKAPEMVPAKAEPPKSDPAKPEPVRLASAAPTTIPAASNNFAAKLLARVDPEFPREAVQAGAEKGMVKARMTLDGNGNVMRVDIVEANPRRIFDRAVVRALSQWRFSDGPSGRTVESEVEFKR